MSSTNKLCKPITDIIHRSKKYPESGWILMHIKCFISYTTGPFFLKLLLLFSKVTYSECTFLLWNWSSIMDILSAVWILMCLCLSSNYHVMQVTNQKQCHLFLAITPTKEITISTGWDRSRKLESPWVLCNIGYPSGTELNPKSHVSWTLLTGCQ